MWHAIINVNEKKRRQLWRSAITPMQHVPYVACDYQCKREEETSIVAFSYHSNWLVHRSREFRNSSLDNGNTCPKTNLCPCNWNPPWPALSHWLQTCVIVLAGGHVYITTHVDMSIYNNWTILCYFTALKTKEYSFPLRSRSWFAPPG